MMNIPERTRKLAEEMPGVKKVLEIGIDVLHYLDAREFRPMSPQSVTQESGRLATQRSIIRSELLWGTGIGDPEYNQASPRMEA